jgi:hypothetical protein
MLNIFAHFNIRKSRIEFYRYFRNAQTYNPLQIIAEYSIRCCTVCTYCRSVHYILQDMEVRNREDAVGYVEF